MRQMLPRTEYEPLGPKDVIPQTDPCLVFFRPLDLKNTEQLPSRKFQKHQNTQQDG